MKKISAEEFDQLSVMGRGRASPVYRTIFGLKPGEAVIIEKQDWPRKDTPTSLARYIERTYNRKYESGRLPDGSGWGFKRVK